MNRYVRRQILRGIAGMGVLSAGSGTATAGGHTEWHEQLDTARDATEAYRGDLDAAKADGWTNGPEFVPQMGYHFVNPDNVAECSDGLDVTEPAVLVYDDPEDDQDLLAVEYLVAGDRTDDPPDLFADEAADDVETSEEEGWEYIPPEQATGLHAWVWFDNPRGMHHPTNPRAPR